MLENMVNFYLAPNLPADRHAFFGRNGGVSEGIYALSLIHISEPTRH